MHNFLVHHELYQMRKQTQQVTEYFPVGTRNLYNLYNPLQYSIL